MTLYKACPAIMEGPRQLGREAAKRGRAAAAGQGIKVRRMFRSVPLPLYVAVAAAAAAAAISLRETFQTTGLLPAGPLVEAGRWVGSNQVESKSARSAGQPWKIRENRQK
jgi:hypothetical protein